MKVKRSLLNIVISLSSQIVIALLGMVVLKDFLSVFGSEVNGLVATIKQIYAYIALLEAGVGAATIQALYSPVAKNDKSAINGILSAANKYYIKAGLFYAIAILIFAVVYTNLINSTVNSSIIVGVILINGFAGFARFMSFGKYTLLFQSEGKNYLLIALTTIVNVCTNLVKLYLIRTGHNVIIVQAIFLFLIYFFNLKRKDIDLKSFKQFS